MVWVSRYHAPRVSFGAWGGLARVAGCLRYAGERFACARFSFVLFGRAPLAAWVYDGGVPRGGGLPVGMDCEGVSREYYSCPGFDARPSAPRCDEVLAGVPLCDIVSRAWGRARMCLVVLRLCGVNKHVAVLCEQRSPE